MSHLPSLQLIFIFVETLVKHFNCFKSRPAWFPGADTVLRPAEVHGCMRPARAAGIHQGRTRAPGLHRGRQHRGGAGARRNDGRGGSTWRPASLLAPLLPPSAPPRSSFSPTSVACTERGPRRSSLAPRAIHTTGAGVVPAGEQAVATSPLFPRSRPPPHESITGHLHLRLSARTPSTSPSPSAAGVHSQIPQSRPSPRPSAAGVLQNQPLLPRRPPPGAQGELNQ
jgi:hypothetical protein